MNRHLHLSFKKCLLLALIIPSAQASTLHTACVDALKKSNDIQIAEALLRESEENLAVSQALLKPQIDSSADLDIIHKATDTKNNYRIKSGNVTFTQSIFDLPKLNQARSDRSALLSQSHTFHQTKQEIVLETIASFQNVLIAQEELAIFTKKKEAMKKNLDKSKKKLDLGSSTRTELAEVQSEYDLSAAKQAQAKQHLLESVHTLHNQTGSVYKIYQTPTLIPRPNKTLSEWSELTLKANPQILSSQHTIKQWKSLLKSKKSEHLPDLSVSGSWVDNRYSHTPPTALTDATTRTLSITANIPLYSGGKTTHEVRKIKAQLIQKKKEYAKLKSALLYQVKNRYEKLSSDAQIVSAYAAAVKSAELKLKLEETSHEVGLRTALDVLHSINTLADTKLEYAKAKHEQQYNIYALMATAGNLLQELNLDTV